MLDNNLIQSTSSWPFVEVRKLLKDRKDIIKKNNKITQFLDPIYLLKSIKTKIEIKKFI